MSKVESTIPRYRCRCYHIKLSYSRRTLPAERSYFGRHSRVSILRTPIIPTLRPMAPAALPIRTPRRWCMQRSILAAHLSMFATIALFRNSASFLVHRKETRDGRRQSLSKISLLLRSTLITTFATFPSHFGADQLSDGRRFQNLRPTQIRTIQAQYLTCAMIRSSYA